jgi:hypothetical protein
MTCHLEALCVDAIDPLRLARFWAGVLGWEMAADGPKISWGGPPLTQKTRKDRFHFDLAPPMDGAQEEEVDRLISLGATRSRHRPGRSQLGGFGRSRWP